MRTTDDRAAAHRPAIDAVVANAACALFAGVDELAQITLLARCFARGVPSRRAVGQFGVRIGLGISKSEGSASGPPAGLRPVTGLRPGVEVASTGIAVLLENIAAIETDAGARRGRRERPAKVDAGLARATAIWRRGADALADAIEASIAGDAVVVANVGVGGSGARFAGLAITSRHAGDGGGCRYR